MCGMLVWILENGHLHAYLLARTHNRNAVGKACVICGWAIRTTLRINRTKLHRSCFGHVLISQTQHTRTQTEIKTHSRVWREGKKKRSEQHILWLCESHIVKILWQTRNATMYHQPLYVCVFAVYFAYVKFEMQYKIIFMTFRTHFLPSFVVIVLWQLLL